MSATFGALPGFQFMHAICHFEDQEVKNPMLQTDQNQGTPAAHESAETPIGNVSNGAVAGDGATLQHEAKIAAMARRLEELEMKKMQEVQAISQTPLKPMPCSICLSYEHLVDECPTIPTVREMFGDCNTYNSNWRNHPNFSWKPQSPQYKQHVQALPQALNLDQAMVNLSKVMGDFLEA
ncbi:hypothetical protein CK203_061243 [Vitis vinifera]|uniref:Retrotransposon gag domain-containing protein n=1 Tax=Vitis vinifera TaxID=29760 RepID=A0A438GK32_VITVI|nr:hypothetical protein CK203_061243 [Vitis vinifera]